jgi:hypothetical protein
MRKVWLEIGVAFEARMTLLFEYQYPTEQLTAYLTTNTRCTYSIAKRIFYVYWKTPNPQARIMHEIFHFYTWHALKENRPWLLAMPSWNDLKESLTVLINLTCSDLLHSTTDKGYPQHIVLRKTISDLWLQSHSLYSIVDSPVLGRLLASAL